jgi:hypothetical protein
MRCDDASARLCAPRLDVHCASNTAARDRRSTDPETGVASGLPEAAICVQDVDVQCVLQFTLVNAAGCALHRHTSRVIHRLEWSIRLRRQSAASRQPLAMIIHTVTSVPVCGDELGGRHCDSLNLAMR